MLQAFREHKRWLMVIAMVFIIPSFVVTGIYSYNRMTQSDNSIVKVGEVSITPENFDLAKSFLFRSGIVLKQTFPYFYIRYGKKHLFFIRQIAKMSHDPLIKGKIVGGDRFCRFLIIHSDLYK